MKFVKKPVVVEAHVWDGLWELAPQWLVTRRGIRIVSGERLEIQTLEGVMTAQRGDWIIKGIKGEVYPCKPDIFEDTYEPYDPPFGGYVEAVKETK